MTDSQGDGHMPGLNGPDRECRIEAVRQLHDCGAATDRVPVASRKDVNNHIHTMYSFSPYYPAAAVWLAEKAGLATAGIMDHDTAAGASEFIEAAGITGLPVTVGAECRASFSGTRLRGRYINNPDQRSIGYVALHGIPGGRIGAVNDFFGPLRYARNKRNRGMTDRLNDILHGSGIAIDYDRDVLPLSMYHHGGSVTDRHILFALAKQLIRETGGGEALIRFLAEELLTEAGGQVRSRLAEPDNPYTAYDLLGLLKSRFMEKIYIEAKADECPDISEVSGFAAANGIILTYAYLGDVTESVTGDKKSQEFEDSYIGELFETLRELGFGAVAYMPSRNTRSQLEHVRILCERYGFLQISGEDINQPRQQFVCDAMRDPAYANLYDAAWALIGHEKMAALNPEDSFISMKTRERHPGLAERTEYFRDIALAEYIK